MGLLERILEDLFGSESQYGVKSTTVTGQTVRSKAEKTIADYFTQQNITYEYEKTAKTNGLIFKDKISKPDFYLPQYDLYVEYWGLLNTDDRALSKRYERAMKYKMAKYHENRIAFVSLYPNNLTNLDYIFRKKFREAKGFDLPARLGMARTGGYFCSACGKQGSPGSRFCSNCGKPVVTGF